MHCHFDGCTRADALSYVSPFDVRYGLFACAECFALHQSAIESAIRSAQPNSLRALGDGDRVPLRITRTSGAEEVWVPIDDRVWAARFESPERAPLVLDAKRGALVLMMSADSVFFRHHELSALCADNAGWHPTLDLRSETALGAEHLARWRAEWERHALPVLPRRSARVGGTDVRACSICLSASRDVFVKTACGHVFHASCLGKWSAVRDSCPVCRSAFT
jgi:hypothetical protein